MSNFSFTFPTGRKLVVLAPAIAAVALLAACGKNERSVTTEERLKAVQTKQETQPDFFVPRKTVDYVGDLKTIRAAAKPDPAFKTESAKIAATEPAKPSQTEPTEALVAPAAPTQPAVAVPAAPVVAAPAPVVAAPAPRPAAEVAVTVVSREQPSFPREAVRQNVESGTVRARMNINALGDVTGVIIISARPVRIFDREVQLALQRWKFNPGADGRTFDTEINFQR